MKIPVLIRMPEDLKEQLQETATKKGMTLTGLVLHILWDWLKTEMTDEMKNLA